MNVYPTTRLLIGLALWTSLSVVVSALPRPSVEASVHLRVESVERFSGDVRRVRDQPGAGAASHRA